MSTSPHRGSLLVIFLTVFIDLLGFGLVLPLLPLYANYFTVDDSGVALGLLMASYSAMQMLFAPLWGRLSDRVGRRPVLMVGLLGSVVFYAGFGVATVLRSFTLLFITRVGAGIAGATIPTAQAYIADTTTKKDRAKGMAFIGMAFGLGFTFGPLFGMIALQDGNAAPVPWPGYAAAGLSAVALLIAIFGLPESRHPGSEKAGRRLLDIEGFRTALAVSSIGMLLIAIFVCVFSFANFESTLSLLIGARKDEKSLFDLGLQKVCLTYAFIGFTLCIVQGGIVRRLSHKIPEGNMAAIGALLEIVGFAIMELAIHRKSLVVLYVALFFVVSGFAFMQPSLNSLLSRRSDPAKQGAVLGFAQSVNALARIFGPAIGIPLLKYNDMLPYSVAIVLMAVGLFLVTIAARSGKDYPA